MEEHVADALKMAGSVLLFVIALSISINAFGEARQTAQIVLDYQDREYDYTYVEDNGTTQRNVGIETMIPSIYKAYRENYKIVFDSQKLLERNKGLYQKRVKSGNFIPVFSIDLEQEVLGSNADREEFIEAILYGPSQETKTKFLTNSGIMLNNEGIYDIIVRNKYTFVEKLGVYYQEEIQPTSGSPDANKMKKRVITYSDT